MKLLAAILVLMSFSINSTLVHASGSDESIAKVRAGEQARKESDARHKAEMAEQRRQAAESEKQSNASMAATMRPLLGAAAVGKSDAEVVRLYEEKVARDDASGTSEKAAADAANMGTQKNITGYNAQQMDDMSDDEIDKTENAMLEKIKNMKH